MDKSDLKDDLIIAFMFLFPAILAVIIWFALGPVGFWQRLVTGIVCVAEYAIVFNLELYYS